MILNFNVLSKTERAVYDKLITGKAITEIADELFVSVKTVKYHQTAINHKLGTTSRISLIVNHYETLIEELKLEVIS